MRYELSQSFYFEAAHTLAREVDAESSRRIHGHTYHAEVTISGTPSPHTGMLVDLGIFRQKLATVREHLDHRLLDEVDGLGVPTLENLCAYILAMLSDLPQVVKIKISRKASGDSCTLICE